jgi:hypothetical protein
MHRLSTKSQEAELEQWETMRQLGASLCGFSIEARSGPGWTSFSMTLQRMGRRLSRIRDPLHLEMYVKENPIAKEFLALIY